NFISVVLYILMFLSTGFFEEILVRGVVLKLFLNKYGKNKKGIYLSVIISSLIFGAAHFDRYITGQSDLMTTLNTIIIAIFLGVSLGAVFLRTKSLWVTIIIHALIDIVGAVEYLKINSLADMVDVLKGTPITLEGILGNIIITLPFFLCGLFFLRKVKYSRNIES
ncbi:MAG: lysostaphin resistance A-like protein, partial [Clostridium sp.]